MKYKEIIESVLLKEPTLTLEGFAAGNPITDAEEEAFNACVDYLSRFKKPKTFCPNGFSYGLKHHVEYQSVANGRKIYVANGVLIAAAIHMGFKYRAPDINAIFSMRSRDVQQFRKSALAGEAL